MNLKKTYTLCISAAARSGEPPCTAEPCKMGKIDKESLKMAVYPEDSSAAAVVLADYGTAYFAFSSDKGFQLMLDKHLRIKILNKNGLEYAN